MEIILLLCLAAVIYRPWDAPHLPLTDFGLFFGARGESSSLLSQYGNVASYYIAEGRLCLITYLYLVLGGAAFGTWATGWHWSYFALNATVLMLAISLLKKLGISRIAIVASLALWLTMGPTAELWLRPAGEPIALIFFLVAMHQALNFHSAPDWHRRALIIAGCAVGIVFTKELLVVLLPAGWLLSRLSPANGEWRWASWTKRDMTLAMIVGASVFVAMIPVVYVAMRASDVSYAAQYSADFSRLPALLNRLEIALVPSVPRLHWLTRFQNDPVWVILRTLPNLLWIIMIVSALAAARRTRVGWPVVVGMAWVGAGVLAYLPWPAQSNYYMMPFALGTMFIAAHALHAPLGTKNKNRRAAIGVIGLLILVSSVEARSTLHQQRLRAGMNGGVIDAIAKQGGADLLIAAVPNPLPGNGGWASHLQGFGTVGHRMPVGKSAEMNCDDAKRALESTPNTVVVSAAGGCGEITDSPLVISGTAPRTAWPTLWRSMRSEGRMYVNRSGDHRRVSDSRSF